MRILIACEESGIVRDAFRKLGFDAYSNDLQKPSGGGKNTTFNAICLTSLTMVGIV
jgi:hypothetical protein